MKRNRSLSATRWAGLILAFALSGTLTSTGAPAKPWEHSPRPAQAERNDRETITVITGDRTGTIPLIDIAGEVLVPLQAISTFLSGQVVETDDPATVRLRAAGREVELTSDRNFVQLGGKLQLLTSPVRIQDARHYVPLDFLTKVAPALSNEPLRYEERSRLWVFGTQYPRLEVTSERLPEYTRIVLEADRAVPFQVEEGDGKVSVRIQTPYLLTSFRSESLGDGVVEDIRLYRDRMNYLVQIGLGDRFGAMKAYELPNPDRVVIDLIRSRVPTGADSESVEADLRSMEERGEDPSPGAESSDGVDVSPGGETLLAEDPTAEGPMLSEGIEPPADPSLLVPRDVTKIRTVTIDPGHGGAETGATGRSGTAEKSVTLSVSRKLQRLLQDRLGFRVFLTRNGDQNVTLERRAEIANSNKSDLFLSIHADASPRSSARGSSVYYQSPAAGNGARSAQGRPRNELSFILWDMAQASHLNQSAQLAEILQEELYGTTGHSGANRGIKQNSFIVLVGANMPAVLVEVGFISNPDEEELLESASYQDRLAEAIYQGVLRYKRQFEGSAPGRAAGREQ